jgi:hypothetical protein
VWPLVLLLLLLLPVGSAQAQSRPGTPPARPAGALDLQVVVVSRAGAPDDVGIAYATPEADEQIKQDFGEIARELGNAAPKVEITRPEKGKKAIPAARGQLTGVTNWQTGTINLNPFISVLRRYGHFRANFVFLGNYPLKSLGSFNQPPVRVVERVDGNSVAYEIWVDQSKGVPEAVPTVQPSTPAGMMIAAVAAIALIVAASVFLILQVIQKQRRAAEPVEGKPLDDTRS